MNIQKERELFEAWVIENLADGRSMSWEGWCWKSWQAAKAQAVPKYHMENIRDALVIACDIKEDEGRFEDSLNYIHQAMIEAQEQNQ